MWQWDGWWAELADSVALVYTATHGSGELGSPTRTATACRWPWRLGRLQEPTSGACGSRDRYAQCTIVLQPLATAPCDHGCARLACQKRHTRGISSTRGGTRQVEPVKMKLEPRARFAHGKLQASPCGAQKLEKSVTPLDVATSQLPLRATRILHTQYTVYPYPFSFWLDV